MMVNEMLRIDHLEKRIAESQAEIIKEIVVFTSPRCRVCDIGNFHHLVCISLINEEN